MCQYMDYIAAKAEAALTNLTLLPEADTGEVMIDAVIVLEKAFEDGAKSEILYRNMNGDTGVLCSVRTDKNSCYWNDKKGESVKIRAVETILDDEPYWTVLEAIPVTGVESLVANHSASDLIKINKLGSKLAPLNRERLFKQLSEYERAGGRLSFEEHETQEEKKDILTSLCTKLEFLRGVMPPEILNTVEYLFSVYGVVSDAEKTNTVKVLQALSTDWDWLSCYEHPVMQDVKCALEDALVHVDTAEALLGELTCVDADVSHRPEPLVLVGRTGEAVAESLAKAAGRKYKILSATTLDDEIMTSGSSRGYSNGQVSQLFTELSLIGKYGVLILHHLERLESKKCLAALENLICKKRLADSFLGVSLPIEHVLFLILTNDVDRLPDFCRSLKKIVISEYTESEIEAIVSETLIPRYAENYGMTPFRLSRPAMKSLCAMALDRSAKCVKAKIRDMLGESIKRGLNPALLTPNQILEMFYSKEKQKQMISVYAKDTIALEEKYIYCRYKGYYSKDVEKRCEALFTVLSDGEKEDASYAKKVLPLLVNTLKSKKSSALSIASVKKKLDETHFGLDVVKETALLTLIKAQTAVDSRLQPILFVGPPGTGKTSIAKSIAVAFQMPFAKIPLNSVTNRGDLIGDSKTVKDAKEGMFLNALNAVGTYRALLLLDEVDKLSECLQNVLLNILDGSGPAYEAFAECNIDFSQTLFLGTANSIHSISEPLRDRFKIVYLSPYTEQEKIQIATQYIIPKLKKELNQKKMEFAEDAIEELVKNHCGQDGVRDLSPAVEEVILKNLNKQVIEKEDVVAALGHTNSKRKYGF